MAGVWKHISPIDKGMMTNMSPMAIPLGGSPFIKNMYPKDGEMRSDFGYTDFPIPSATKTNELNGTVMKLAQLYKTNGTSYLICLTTTNAYQYNTSTETWDDISWGTNIDLCETAWTASADVTSTRDTAIKLQGTYSAKHVVAAGFTTGLASYYNTGAKDISDTDQHTYLMFWARATAAVAAGVFRIRLSEEVGGGTGATYADYNVPALVADTWTHCIVDITSPAADNGGTYPDDLNAVLSVGLVANSDPGEVTIYLDHIKAGRCFTGDEDNRFSVATYNDYIMVSNGLDHIYKYTGSGTFTRLTTTLAAGSITNAEIITVFKDHVVAMNTTENGADCNQRVSWTNIGKYEDWVGGTAGYQDLTDDESWIVAAEQIGENAFIIYKERSMVMMTWVGGNTPLRFQTVVSGSGIVGKEAVTTIDGIHIVVGPNTVFGYAGSDIKPIDTPIKTYLYDRLDAQYSNRAFSIYVEQDNELQLWLPTTSTTPNEVWCLNSRTKAWYSRRKSMTGFGFYKEQSTKTIGDLVGTIGEQNWRFGDSITKASTPITLVGDSNGKVYKLDKAALNDDGTAIEKETQTPDYVMPDTKEYQNMYMRVTQLLLEVKGQSVTVEYSTDSGLTWNPTCGGGANVIALTGVYKVYQQDFDVATRKIRFRFTNAIADSSFTIRYYGFYWIPRSGRV